MLKFSARFDLRIAVLPLLLWSLSPTMPSATESLPRSILVLEQSDPRGVFYSSIFAGLRSTNVLKTIFDPFHTTKANRLSMALTIARTIIESHGGSTRAVNQRDRGAAFNITLPLARAGTR